MMRKIPAFLMLSLALGPTSAHAQETQPSPPAALNAAKAHTVLEKAVNGFIRPGYARFQEMAATLQGAMRGLCAAPSQTTLAAARTAFGAAVASWSGIEIVRAGPALAENRFERILYYPDRKGLGLKQVQRALSERDESVTDTASLRDKSVAAQGLGALEFVLYGAGSDSLLSPADDFRCRYGAAIAGNIANLAGELTAAWSAPDGPARDWTAPGPDNPVFRNEREALVALLGILVHGAETVRDQRIETFYKGSNKAMAPRAAIYWRSGQTWASIAANIASLRTLLLDAGMASLLPPQQRSIVDQIDFIALSMTRVAATITPDIDKALTEPRERGKIDYLLLNTKDSIDRLNDQYGGAIGMSSGFSFADGD